MEYIFPVVGIFSSLFGGSTVQPDMGPILNAMKENEKKFKLTIEQLNLSQNKILEQFNKIKKENQLFHEEIIKERNEELKKKEEDEKKLKESFEKTKKELLNKTNEGCEKLLNECENIFDNNKKKWCLEDIIKKKFSFFQIFKIFKDDLKLENYYKNKLKEEINKKNIENVSCYNIQIVGYTGVGKSTLIKNVLNEKIESCYINLFFNLCFVSPFCFIRTMCFFFY